MHDAGLLSSTEIDGERAGLTEGEAWSRRRGWGVAEDLEAVLYWRHGRVGELPVVGVDGDGFRDRTDEDERPTVPQTNSMAPASLSAPGETMGG
jgi:hypothetical protein